MRMRRLSAALALPCMLFPAAEAIAQTSPAPIVGSVLAVPQPTTNPPMRDRFPAPALRDYPDAPRGGLIAAVPVGDDAVIGVGRFSVGEIARPRTNTEFERNPTDIRRRRSGIAGMGFSLRF